MTSDVAGRIVGLFKLTRREYYADFWVTPPLTALLTWHSLAHGGFGVLWAVEFVAGLVVWTFYEYALHRFILHGLPFWRDIHALHHRNQLDYIAQPPWATLATYALFFAVLGVRSSAAMIGFSTGYILYAAAHTAFHYARFRPGSFLWRLDQRHVAHHRYGAVCYGITVDWWDRVFRTEAPVAAPPDL